MVLPMFLLFIFGTVEIGRFMWSEHALDYAAEQASRYALANPSASLAEVQNFAEAQVMTVNDTDVNVSVVNETLDGIDYLKVTVSGTYCREYQTQIIIAGRVENARGTACRQPDGTWKKV